jgi:hypothetical protein
LGKAPSQPPALEFKKPGGIPHIRFLAIPELEARIESSAGLLPVSVGLVGPDEKIQAHQTEEQAFKGLDISPHMASQRPLLGIQAHLSPSTGRLSRSRMFARDMGILMALPRGFRACFMYADDMVSALRQRRGNMYALCIDTHGRARGTLPCGLLESHSKRNPVDERCLRLTGGRQKKSLYADDICNPGLGG